jgi:hypothetical protein
MPVSDKIYNAEVQSHPRFATNGRNYVTASAMPQSKPEACALWSAW